VTESLILGLVGGALGVLVAVWAVDGVTALIPKSAPRASEITLDGTAVIFAVACSIVAALLFGIAPIVHARKTDIHGALKDGSPRMTGSKARLRVRRGLVVTEIALAVVLVVGCTVMVRSFVRLQNVDVGFSPDHVLTFGVELPQKSYPGVTGDQFWDRLDARLEGLPGVTGVTMLDGSNGMIPIRPVNANDFELPGRTRPPRGEVPWNVDYFQTMNAGGFEALGAKIVRGRGIEAQDAAGAPPVVVINEAFAKKFFAHEDPIGKQIQVGYWKDESKTVFNTVVGVVHDIKNAGVDKPAGTELWVARPQVPILNEPPTSENIQYVLVRTTGDPGELVPAVYRAVSEIDPRLPLFQVRTMDDLMWDAVAKPRFLTFLLSCFAAIALLLAAVGIYGVMAHTVAQRTHEIGLRVALGAQPSHVRAMVVKQAASLVAAGVAVGLAAAVILEQALTSSLRGLFYGEQISQPALLGAVALAVAATALLATWVPVRRATSVQPIVALRSE
jgi:putative ABC transport system permease protein